jgi:hypothetical protein
MIRFKSLLLENPDTVYYKKKTYSYRSPANKCAFLVYKDDKSGKNAIFGYSLVKKEFYCDDPEVLKDVDELSKQPSLKLDTNKNSEDQLNYWGQRAITNLKNSNSGGGHLDIENLLKGIGRFGIYADPLLKGRIFEVDDAKDVVDDSHLKIETTIPSGKAIIVTFWDSKRDKIIKYKDQYDKVIGFNGYDPKECLYEPSMNFYTYDNFYNGGPSIAEKPLKTTTSNTTDSAPWNTQTGGNSVSFKVGDNVKVRGMKTSGVVVSIAGDKITIRITDTDVEGVSVGSEKTFSSWFLEPDAINNTQFKVGDKVKYKGYDTYGEIKFIDGNTIIVKINQSDVPLMPVGVSFSFPPSALELDKRTHGETIEKVIDDKTQEFIEKRGKLHTTGAKFTPAEKANLEKEVDSLEIELKILNDLLNNGIKNYTDNVKDVVAKSIQRKLHAMSKEKQDRYSLIAQAEKQYGMPIAQIRQKYRGIPLDKLVKKESLMREILRSIIYRRKFANDKY